LPAELGACIDVRSWATIHRTFDALVIGQQFADRLVDASAFRPVVVEQEFNPLLWIFLLLQRLFTAFHPCGKAVSFVGRGVA